MLRAVTPEPDFLEFLDTFNEHESHADKPSLRPSSILERPTSSTHRRHLPASCSSQSRVHQPLVGLQGFLDLLPPGPEDQSPPRIPTPRKLYPSAEREHIQLFEGARDLLEPLLDSPPAQLLRPRDDVAVDPLEPLLDVSYQGAQGQLRELQGSSSSVTPVPVAHGCTSCTNTRSPDLSSSNSQLEVGQRNRLCFTGKRTVFARLTDARALHRKTSCRWSCRSLLTSSRGWIRCQPLQKDSASDR